MDKLWNVKLSVEHEGKRSATITHRLTQINRAEVMEGIAAIRNEGRTRDLEGIGRPVLSVPFEDMAELRRRFPDLGAPDAQIRTQAWRRFLASPLSRPYRLQA